MNLFRYLWAAMLWPCALYFGGSKSSSSNSTNVTNQYDQRAITTVDDRDTTSNYTADNSVRISDSSSRSNSWADNSDRSNRSTTTTNITTSDPGAVRLGELNSQLLGMVAETQTDAVKTLANFGTQGFAHLGESVTDVYKTAGQNTAQAWSATVNKSGDLIEKLIGAAGQNSDAARSIAQSAISSFQPTENKQGDAMKWGAIALAVVAGLAIFTRA